MEKLPPPINFKGASEMPYCTVSVADMRWNATGTWRYLRPGYVEQIPACEAACPACEPIEKWIAHLEAGNVQKAWETLTAENPFPGLMGRVCFHPCERGCNRKDNGGAVTINALERHLADSFGYNNGAVKPWKAPTGKKIAVAGSGPAGLSCAYFLAMLGHSVTVFEKSSKPGGLFRYGIPQYRLPKDILEKEIKKLFDLGIKFECGKTLSKTDCASLVEKYDAVFAAFGAHISRPLGVEGEKADGVMPALAFLEETQLKLEDNKETAHLLDDKNVTVVGGGNSAIDAARMSLRLGAKSVKIIYRRSRAEMPAFEDEINAAEKEGVGIEFLTAPKKVITEKGRATSLECQRMKLGDPDSSGRRTPIPVSGSEFIIKTIIKTDLVLTAIGEIVDQELIPPENPKIFTGGDMLEQPRTVVNAIGSGKLAAIKIDCLLQEKKFGDIFEKIRIPETNYVRMAGYIADESALHPNTTLKNKIARSEHLNRYYFDSSAPSTESPLTKESAKTQMERCMHCGCCTKCDNCFIYCPDVAVLKVKDTGYDFDYNFCKGCGVCVKECPRAAMEMIEEPT
jgi:2-oxoacid:acceptor oxidoreductase delta subunit (pyruvate/2-ketoisovalerate family)